MSKLPERGSSSPITRPSPIEHPFRGEGDDAGVSIVSLHELLDTQGNPVNESELLSDVFLIAKRESILLPTGAQMQEISDAPEQLSSIFELSNFSREQCARSNVVLFVARAPACTRRPLRHVQVPQAAASLFYIWL
jgi:hypothetical protein